MNFSDVRQGWNIFSSDGDKVCEVSSVGPNYLHCAKGWLFPKDLYIPNDAISRIDYQAVHLNIPKDRIENMDWDRMPEYREGVTPTAGAYREPFTSGFNFGDIQQGWDVYCLNDEKCGTIDSVGENYLHISKGMLFSKDLYVPRDSISRVDTMEHRVFLNVPKDRMETMGWDRMPGYREYATPTTETFGERPIGRFNFRDVQPGWGILDANGDKVCDVSSVEANYLHCTKGFLFNKDLYFPMDALNRCDADAHTCYLNVSKDRIDQMNWYQPPVSGERYEYRPGESPETTYREEREFGTGENTERPEDLR